MIRIATTLLAAPLLAGAAAAQLTLTEIGTVDLDSTASSANAEFIGSNPSAVAWDGADLFVAGFNNSGGTADVGIVKVSDALGAASFGTSFGVLSTPNLRGYSGLDVADAGLAAAYDDGATDPDDISLYVVPGGGPGTQVWNRDARAGSGVGFDPGFPGGNPALGEGVAWTTFGSGRRSLQNALNGGDIWDSTNGMVILTPEGTFWRDIDFDDDTGDVWLREGNNVIHWERTGDNAVANSSIVFDPADADFTNGQNIAFMNAPCGDLVIYNDRSGSGAGQDFFSVVNVIEPDGTAANVSWGGFAPGAGVGYYDFSWHAATRTLAVLDFANRNVHIFALDDAVGATYCGPAVPNSTGQSGKISATGSATASDNDLTLTACDLPLNAFGYFINSQSQGLMMGPGSAGFICLSGSVGRHDTQIQNSGAAGTISITVDLANLPQPTGAVPVMAGETWNFQCWHRDMGPAGAATSNFTDGVSIQFD